MKEEPRFLQMDDGSSVACHLFDRGEKDGGE